MRRQGVQATGNPAARHLTLVAKDSNNVITAFPLSRNLLSQNWQDSVQYIKAACPICGTGTRGFRLCKNAATVVIMCDECDSVWSNPANIGASDVVYMEEPDFRIPGMSGLAAYISNNWATRVQVDDSGWGWLVCGEAPALDEL